MKSMKQQMLETRIQLKIAEYTSPREFLGNVEETLLRNECVNGLTLGICRALVTDLFRYGSQPFLATVQRGKHLEVAALMTPPYKLQLCADDDCDPEALRLIAMALHDGDWPVPAVLASQPLAERFASIWCELTGARSQIGTRQRIHELRLVVEPAPPPGEMVLATEADLALAEIWIHAFHEDILHEGESRPQRDGLAQTMVRDGRLYFWDDGGRRSMAGRTRPTPNGESIGAVYTPPEFRRNGYASAVAAGLSQRILDDGKSFCALYTDLSNPTSNHIYREIGFLPVADVVDIQFQ